MQQPFAQILMATYNGAAYLEEQIDSILAQTHENWELLIRDDGSTDQTAKIANKYASRHPSRIRVIKDDLGNIGCARNFEALCNVSTAPYVAFADQDDIWLSEKLSQSLTALQQMETITSTDNPLLVHHDFRIVDAKGKLLANSCNENSRHDKQDPHQTRMPYDANIHGFSMTANRALLEKALPFPETFFLHDTVIGCLAGQIGEIVYIPEQLADYRRHGSNTSNDKSFSSRMLQKIQDQGNISGVFGIVASIIDEARDNVGAKIEATASYLDRYGTILPEKERQRLEAFVNYRNQSLLTRGKLMWNQPSLSTRSKALASLMAIAI